MRLKNDFWPHCGVYVGVRAGYCMMIFGYELNCRDGNSVTISQFSNWTKGCCTTFSLKDKVDHFYLDNRIEWWTMPKKNDSIIVY